MKFSKPAFAVIGVVILAVILIGVRLAVWTGDSLSASPSLPTLGGPFALTDQNGKAVTQADYQGRYMLIFFGYTFCPDVCPTTLSTVSSVLDKMKPAEAAKIVPIFITIDPERDTVPVMKTYVEAFNPAIQGLTGTPEQIAKVAKAFKVYAAKVKGDSPDSYTMDHSAILYLMGPDGRFVAHFVHGLSADDLMAGLKKHVG